MRSLLDDVYVPYGSQYYRAPSPRPEDWDRDHARMAELGFTMVKYWLQWRWNHPAEDRYDWDDIDRLMDVADRHGLRVMLNTIVDVAPAWVYQKYPDASMVTLAGERIGPQTQPHRQIGGLGLSLCHAPAQDHMFRWLRAAIERYSDHPALAIWNVGSEPELTQSMAEMRLWADDAQKIGDMLDYNPHAVAAFRRWLAETYGGEIDALNTAWKRNYQSFDEAEVPRTRNTFNDLVDWRTFFVDVLGQHVRRRFEVAREADAGRHPLMCHHVFLQGFPTVSTANDPWNVGQTGDLHGITQMDDPMMCDVLRSCARGKPIISAEMLMLMGYTLDLPHAITADDIKRHVFTGLAANLKGFLFWQYRPETLGREAPTWGLSHLDGSSTPWLESFAEIGRVLQEHADFVLDCEPRPSQVAVLYSPDNQIFTWAATGNEKNATDSILGAHRALYDRNHVVDLVHPVDFEGDTLDQYRVIVAPFPYWLSAEIAERLKEWVQAGGVLIAEAYAGGWDVEGGRHHTTVPGYGLDEVFGARQRNAEPASEHEYALVHGATRASEVAAVRGGVAGDGTVAAQPFDPSGGLGRVEVVASVDLPGFPAGSKAYGALVKETFSLEGADVLATYADGQPAVTSHAWGDGRAVLIGSYVTLPHQRTGERSNGALVAALVDHAVALERPQVVGDGAVRVDVLEDGDGQMLVVRNLEGRPVRASLSVPGLEAGPFAEVFGGDEVEATATAEGASLTVALGPEEVRVYRG
ncbi:beta-galactosidase [Rubrivirga sp.]|uniref:beta-galactosidase n=1 Tax=Rubrivirga sp. TaxID=1885344 RepID=UPI003B51B10A